MDHVNLFFIDFLSFILISQFIFFSLFFSLFHCILHAQSTKLHKIWNNFSFQKTILFSRLLLDLYKAPLRIAWDVCKRCAQLFS